MTDFELRPATRADVPRIREIAAQIWEGDDYLGDSIEHWLSDPRGEVVVATAEGQVVGLGRLLWLLPGYAWLEGLRTDPALQKRGAAKALTAYFMAKAQRAGATHIGLSTYLDNHASRHIVTGYGFSQTAQFIFCEAPRDGAARELAALSTRVEEISVAEALPWVQNSAFLQLAAGQLPYGWKFFPFAHAPETALEAMAARLGLRDTSGRLIALICLGSPIAEAGEAAINFLDGEPEAMAELLRHALALYQHERWIGMMIPQQGNVNAPALAVAQALAFVSWKEFTADVFVYEREAC